MIFSSLLFGLFCLFREINLILKKKTINIVNIFGIMYGMTYGILTAYYLHYTQYHEIQYHRILQQSSSDLWLWHVYAIVSYVVIQVVYYNVCSKKIIDTTIMKETRKKEIDILQWTAIICALIGTVSFCLWGSVYESVLDMIIEGNKIRSGVPEIYNPYSFMIRWVNLLFISILLFIKLIKLGVHKKLNLIILFPLVYINIIYLLVCDGRLMMAMFTVLVILSSFDLLKIGNVNRKYLVVLACVGIFALMLVLKLDGITYYIRTDEILDESDLAYENNFIVDEFGYIFKSAQQASSQCLTIGSPLLLVDDLVMGLFAWIPSRFKPDLDLVNIWNYNTDLYFNGSFSGQMPCDFVTHSLYTCGIFGSMFMVIIWSLMIVLSDNIIRKNNDPFLEGLGYYMVYRFIYLVNYCSIFYFIQGLFSVFMAVIIWRMVKYIYSRR